MRNTSAKEAEARRGKRPCFDLRAMKDDAEGRQETEETGQRRDGESNTVIGSVITNLYANLFPFGLLIPTTPHLTSTLSDKIILPKK